jgi:hypothetical protein
MICYTVEHGNRLSLHTTLVGMTVEDYYKIKDLPFENICLHLPDKDHYANIPITEEYLRVLDLMLDSKDRYGKPLICSANTQSKPDEYILKFVNHRLAITNLKLIDRAGNIKDTNIAENIKLCGKIRCLKSHSLTRNVLLPDGSLSLCCMDFGLNHVIGNLIEKSYDKIRMGEKVNRVLQQLDEEYNELICRSCSMAVKL